MREITDCHLNKVADEEDDTTLEEPPWQKELREKSPEVFVLITMLFTHEIGRTLSLKEARRNNDFLYHAIAWLIGPLYYAYESLPVITMKEIRIAMKELYDVHGEKIELWLLGVLKELLSLNSTWGEVVSTQMHSTIAQSDLSQASIRSFSVIAKALITELWQIDATGSH